MDVKFGLSVMYKKVEYKFILYLKTGHKKLICLGSGNKVANDHGDNSRSYSKR